jgi:DNA-binding winged helix-turn-helix (wHTH) protein
MTRLAFTHHVLHLASRQIFRDGAPVHLSPKAMDLLLCLVAHPDRYLSKEELQGVLWPGMRVGTTSLPGLVKELRRALGDTAEAPVVRTLHGRGYQFCAELRVASAEPGFHGSASAPDAETELSLPPEVRADGSALGLATLWPPAGPRLRLAERERWELGRAEGCALHLPYEKVSRRHAEILRRGPAFVLHDLGSTNGTYVQGERVREGAVLRDHVLLRCGEWLALLTCAAQPEVPAALAHLAAARDWSGRVRELESACLQALVSRPEPEARGGSAADASLRSVATGMP